MKEKKVLIHSLIFSPDGVSAAYLYNDIALAFKEAGYDEVVLSTTPHFNVVLEQMAEGERNNGVRMPVESSRNRKRSTRCRRESDWGSIRC